MGVEIGRMRWWLHIWRELRQSSCVELQIGGEKELEGASGFPHRNGVLEKGGGVFVSLRERW